MGTSTLALKNEERLLVLAAEEAMRPGPCDERVSIEASSLLESVFEWRRFMKLACRSLSAAAACGFFRELGLLGGVPSEARHALERERMLAQARFLKKEADLLEIANALERAGIDPLVIKGTALARLLYRDPGVRESKDIDILVKRSDLENAKGALLGIGYGLYEGIHRAEDYRAYHFHYVFSRGTPIDSVVELHWDLLNPAMSHYAFDEGEVWKRAIPVPGNDRPMRTLSLPHALWHLCMHASQKDFLAFRSLVEMRGIARRLDEAGWNEMLAWSSRCNTNREAAIAFSLCESLCGAFLDANARRALRPGARARIFVLNTYYPRALVWEWLPFAAAHELAVSLHLRGGFVSRLAYLFRLVVPDRETRFKLYFKYRGDRFFDRMKLHLNGIYVVLKVAFLALFMGALVRSGILGSRALDPERNVGD